MSSCGIPRIADTFGQVQLAAHDQAVLIDVDAHNYTTTGHLHVSHAHVRLPLSDAIRLHALLAEVIVAAEESNPRQSGLWVPFSAGVVMTAQFDFLASLDHPEMQ